MPMQKVQESQDLQRSLLAAWNVTSNLTIAALTAAWGVLAAVIGLREAVAAAGALLLLTPLLLVRPRRAPTPSPVPVPAPPSR